MAEFIDNFHFLRPLWLLAILPALILFMLLHHRYRRQSAWRGLIDDALLPYLLDGQITRSRKIPLYALFGLWLVASLALAGPTWKKSELPVQKDVSAMVILWDLSPSMLAEDLPPSRLVRARLKLVDLLNARREGLTALVAYAGDAHVVTPLTDDTRTIKSLLPGLNPAMMPAAGSNTEAALESAIELLRETGIQKGDILIVTDGIAADAHSTLRAIGANTQHRVTVWGIGTQEGAPIPLPSGGFAKNSRGEIVVAKVDDQRLSDAAIAMDGVYIPFTSDASDIRSIMHFGLQMDNSASAQNERGFDQWEEQGHWLVLLMLPFAALAFRRGWLLSVVLVFLPPSPSQAFEWQDLWLTPDQQGKRLLDSDEPAAAAEHFKDPDWKGIADYRAGNFPEAQAQFQHANDAIAKFNFANALTQSGAYDKAIAAYDEALQLRPDFTQARDNRVIAEQLKRLEENQAQQTNSEQEQNNQTGEQQDGENQDSQGQASESSQEPSAQQQAGQQNQTDKAQQGQQNADADTQETEKTHQQISDAQQQALQSQYGQENADHEQQQELNAEQLSKSEQNDQEDASQEMISARMSAEQKEQQQALEQWLRRVPDDPSGLLREKFRYEYQMRRREMQDRNLRNPDQSLDERW